MNPQYNITAKFSLPYLSGVFPLGLAAGLLVFTSIFCGAQGTMVIGFEGPPKPPLPNSGYLLSEYIEWGFRFSEEQFVRIGPGTSGFPDNGTAYIQHVSLQPMLLTHDQGDLFGLISVDLAGYSEVVPELAVEFIGYKPGGGTVTASFSGTGIIFNTFSFGPDFAGLDRVEIFSESFSLDNLVVIIPEPGVARLLLLGLGAFAFQRRRV